MSAAEHDSHTDCVASVNCGNEEVTCGEGFVSKPSTTACEDCESNGSECCLPTTCGDKTGLDGGAVTCSNTFFPKPASHVCSTCATDDPHCCAPKHAEIEQVWALGAKVVKL